MSINYYEVLQVSEDATFHQVKIAYKRMAQKYHPDKNPGDAAANATFLQAKEAYDILSYPTKRARFDKYGHLGVNINIDIDREAVISLTDSLMNFIDQASDVDTTDIIKAFKKRADLVIEGYEKQIKSINKNIVKSEKVKNKLKKKKVYTGENIFISAFNKKIDGLNRDLYAAETTLKITVRVVEIIEEYDYDFTACITSDSRSTHFNGIFDFKPEFKKDAGKMWGSDV